MVTTNPSGRQSWSTVPRNWRATVDSRSVLPNPLRSGGLPVGLSFRSSHLTVVVPSVLFCRLHDKGTRLAEMDRQGASLAVSDAEQENVGSCFRAWNVA